MSQTCQGILKEIVVSMSVFCLFGRAAANFGTNFILKCCLININAAMRAVSNFDILTNFLDLQNWKECEFFNSLGNSDSSHICRF